MAAIYQAPVRASLAGATPVPRRLLAALPLSVAVWLGTGGTTASAQSSLPLELYQATVIVTGTDMRSRPAGFARAFVEVLVKVTGNPKLSSDPRSAALAARADALVSSFEYFDPIAARRPHDDQGTYDRSYDLTVHFDPPRIDDAVRALGARPWAGPRPSTALLVAVRGSDPPWVGSFLLTADDPLGAAQRLAVTNAAAKYGMEVRLPTQAELQTRGIRLDGALPERAVSDPGDVSIVGAIEFRPAALGWVGSWRMSWGAVVHQSGVGGVSFDEIFDRMVQDALTLASGSTPLD